jgi:hypothetical protein
MGQYTCSSRSFYSAKGVDYCQTALLSTILLFCIAILISVLICCSSSSTRSIPETRHKEIREPESLVDTTGLNKEETKCSVYITTRSQFEVLGKTILGIVAKKTGCDTRYKTSDNSLSGDTFSSNFCIFKGPYSDSPLPESLGKEQLCERISTKKRGVQNFLYTKDSGAHLEELSLLCGMEPDSLKLTAPIGDLEVIEGFIKGERDVLGVFPSSIVDYETLVRKGLVEIEVDNVSCSVLEVPDFGDMTVRIHSSTLQQRSFILSLVQEYVESLDEESKPKMILATVQER